MEDRILELMNILNISREEAIDVIESDNRIDKGEKLFELNKEQKQAEKKMRGGAKAVNAYGRTVIRERKTDNEKKFLIDNIFSLLEQLNADSLEKTNPEREINFVFENRKFKIVLSAPRK